jgi:uncharacterized membrane protein
MNTKFPVLSFLSFVLIGTGWLLLLLAFYFLIYEGLIEPNQPGHRFTNNDLMQAVGGGIALVFGIFSVATGELIKVFFAIEENTRKA